jgi:hypothetical protein
MSDALTPHQVLGGAEKLRARHMPFSIGDTERDLRLACMRQAMRDVQVEEGLSEALANAFYKTADHLRNRPDSGECRLSLGCARCRRSELPPRTSALRGGSLTVAPS